MPALGTAVKLLSSLPFELVLFVVFLLVSFTCQPRNLTAEQSSEEQEKMSYSSTPNVPLRAWEGEELTTCATDLRVKVVTAEVCLV